MLTEDQIDAIAAEARTKPLSEIGRHVMPLVQHIVGMDMLCCRGCRSWIPYSESRDGPPIGECTHRGVRVGGLDVLREPRPLLLTPADWCCRGWEEKKA